MIFKYFLWKKTRYLGDILRAIRNIYDKAFMQKIAFKLYTCQLMALTNILYVVMDYLSTICLFDYIPTIISLSNTLLMQYRRSLR